MAAPQARSPSIMDPSALAGAATYAKALLEGTASDEQAEALAAELSRLVELIDGVEGAQEFLAGAALGGRQQARLLERLFAGRVSPALEAFLAVLGRHGRMNLLPAVGREFRRLLDQREGKVQVNVTTAVPLDAEQCERVRSAVRDMIGAEPVLNIRVDESIIGGIVLRVGDRTYDASLAGRLGMLLDRLRERAKAARPSRPAEGS